MVAFDAIKTDTLSVTQTLHHTYVDVHSIVVDAYFGHVLFVLATGPHQQNNVDTPGAENNDQNDRMAK